MTTEAVRDPDAASRAAPDGAGTRPDPGARPERDARPDRGARPERGARPDPGVPEPERRSLPVRALRAVLAMFGLGERSRWTWVRLGLLMLYAGTLLWRGSTAGIPDGWIPLASIIIIGLGITRLGRGWRPLVQIVIDWLPFTVVLIAYDKTRGLADDLGIPLNLADIAHAETWLFGGVEPTVWLQAHLYNARRPDDVHWYDALCTLVYTSHFLSTPVVAAVLWLRDRVLWVRFVSRVIVLSLAGLVTYIVFPEAPPWYASNHHVIGPVARLSTRGWIFFDADDVNSALAHAQSAGANPVAAMPSLHTAFATLIALFLAGRFRSRWRYLFALYPLAMGFALVYCGEHYVLDIVAGVLYALAANTVLTRWEHRRAAAEHLEPGDLTDLEAPVR